MVAERRNFGQAPPNERPIAAAPNPRIFRSAWQREKLVEIAKRAPHFRTYGLNFH
jgi:hypothetical protein